MVTKNISKQIGASLILLILSSCINLQTSPQATAQFTATELDKMTFPVVTSTIVSDFTPTALPAAESTIQPTKTPPKIAYTLYPKQTITPTPLPTLAPDQAWVQVRELLMTNGGCELPCFWGISLGEATWFDVKRNLETFTDHIGQGGAEVTYENGVKSVATNYTVQYHIEVSQTKGKTIFGVKDGIVRSVSAYPPGTELSYQLHQMLSKYGKPDEVTIYTLASVPESYWPFQVFLYYERGIYAFYDFQAEKVGDMLRGCIQPIGPELFLWSPDLDTFTSREIAHFVLGADEEIQFPKPLENVTGMTIDQFYETFIVENSHACLETPADLWP